jgi:cell division protein FtsX
VKAPLQPWLLSPERSGRHHAAMTLLAVGWIMAGSALWAISGLREWMTGLRPAVVVDVFLGETMTPTQMEAFSQSILARPYACNLRYFSAEEAKAEAATDERLRPLLGTFGGNPFLRFFRITMTPGEIEKCREAGDWLKAQPGVVSVRVPAAQVDMVIQCERQIAAAVRTATAEAGVLAALVILAALWLLAIEVSQEISVWEGLGAAQWMTWVRAVRVICVPAVVSSVLVAIGLKLMGGIAMFGGRWFQVAGSQLPDFPYAACRWLAGAALVAGLLVSVVLCLGRRFARPA